MDVLKVRIANPRVLVPAVYGIDGLPIALRCSACQYSKYPPIPTYTRLSLPANRYLASSCSRGDHEFISLLPIHLCKVGNLLVVSFCVVHPPMG